MIVPEPEDISYANKMAIDFTGRFSQLHENFSPILPLHFDKSYLPENICEKEFISLTECTVFKSNSDESTCSYQIARFEQCRKNRDIKILEGIREWETKHIIGLDKTNRQMYLQGLTFKLDRLKEEYEKLPSTQAKQLKLHRIESEIEQLKWRMKHIRGLLDH